MMRNELLNMGNKNPHILKSVIQRSTDVCKIRYVKPILKEDSHLDLYRRCKKLFDNRQMFALKELYKWRDTIARTEDESIGQVVQDLNMFTAQLYLLSSPTRPFYLANYLKK